MTRPQTAIIGAGAAGLSLGLMLHEQGDDDFTIFEQYLAPGGLARSEVFAGYTFDMGPHVLSTADEAAAQWITDHCDFPFRQGRTFNKALLPDGRLIDHPMPAEYGEMYQKKMWGYDPADLVFDADRKPGGDRTWLYPERGGYGAITSGWAERLKERIVYGSVWRYGEHKEFDRVVWTAPIPGLTYNVIALAAVCYEGEAPPWTAVYLPGDNSPYHRVFFPAAFSPFNAPDGYYAMVGECRYATAPRGPLVDIGASLGLGQARNTDWNAYIPAAYPVPLRSGLGGFAVVPKGYPDTFELHGRTGSHRYINLDQVVRKSMELAVQLSDS